MLEFSSTVLTTLSLYLLNKKMQLTHTTDSFKHIKMNISANKNDCMQTEGSAPATCHYSHFTLQINHTTNHHCAQHYYFQFLFRQLGPFCRLRWGLSAGYVGAFLQATSRVPRWWIGERPPDMAASCDIYK